MRTKILLISPGGEIRKKYKKAFEEHGASVIAVSSFNRLNKTASESRYHGVAVDLPTKIMALRKDKGFVYRVLGRFPFVQLCLNKKTGKIKFSYNGRLDNSGLAEFINQKCRHARPKKFRYQPRARIHFNVLLSENKRFEEGAYERAVTMDASRMGCFVYTIRSLAPGRMVWIVMEELSDHTPIRAEVRHNIPWGESMSIPGVGLKFTAIKKTQIKEICEDFLDLKTETGSA
ncbi:MAG: hypothetical protein GY859_33920, partial [Desulfobacterales bacterium]|nr:hypothetical protein [Desulfobacterales bacterium]